ncbi:MAG: ABC transporter permease [Lachnospiraceae bacterium]|nr:ABC transporter permease [Lachnospiraceae bacterium]
MKDFFRRLCRNRLTVVCLILFVAIVLVVLCAGIIAPYGWDEGVVADRFQAPSLQHLCGTDNMGRDIFSRILYGGQMSLAIGLAAAAITSVIGTIIGSVSAYFGGAFDNVVMRILDVFMALPPMLLAVVIAATLGNGMMNTLLAVIISGIPGKARVARGPVLALRNQEFVEAATASNSSTAKIIFRHIIPNIMAQVIVQMTLSISGTIVSVAGLSFLGLGVQPPAPEWGAMLSAGRSYLRDYPWMVIAPGIAMMLTLFSLNVVGDGVRDALDPKLRD